MSESVPISKILNLVSRYPDITVEGLRLLLPYRIDATNDDTIQRSYAKLHRLLRIAKRDLSLSREERLNPKPSTPLQPMPLRQISSRQVGIPLTPVARPRPETSFSPEKEDAQSENARELRVQASLVYEDDEIPDRIGTPDSKGRLYAHHSDAVIEELIFNSPIEYELSPTQASNRHRG